MLHGLGAVVLPDDFSLLELVLSEDLACAVAGSGGPSRQQPSSRA